MARRADAGRDNQRRRTRKDLLAAASRLLKAGRVPEMEEVAAEAMVSRATAYRYFPSVEALLVEAPLDGIVPGAEEVFAGDTSTDVEERVDRAEAAMHASVYRNEAQLRVMLARSLERVGGARKAGVPVRQNRRAGLIAGALAPARGKMGRETYERLCAALAMIFGVESMIVFEDVVGVEEKKARRVKSWAVRALVRAALAEGKKEKA